MTGIDYAIVAVFFVGIFAAGAYFYKWIGDADDFYVAGRKLTPFILAATITATNVNLYSFVGQAGKDHVVAHDPALMVAAPVAGVAEGDALIAFHQQIALDDGVP